MHNTSDYNTFVDKLTRNYFPSRRLFNEDEIAVVDRFRSKGGGGLSLDARRLYVRLFERKFDWIRREKINYGGKEVGNEDGALRELEGTGFLRTGNLTFIR